VGVDDPSVPDPERVEPRLPRLQLGPVRDPEGEVVQPHAVLVEPVGPAASRELVEAEERASRQQVHGVVVAPGVLVEDRLRPQQPLVPRDARGQVGHGQRYVGHARELGHRAISFPEPVSSGSPGL